MAFFFQMLWIHFILSLTWQPLPPYQSLFSLDFVRRGSSCSLFTIMFLSTNTGFYSTAHFRNVGILQGSIISQQYMLIYLFSLGNFNILVVLLYTYTLKSLSPAQRSPTNVRRVRPVAHYLDIWASQLSRPKWTHRLSSKISLTNFVLLVALPSI